MTLAERKRIVVNTMDNFERKKKAIEDRLVALKHCEYDGFKPLMERDQEIQTLQKDLLNTVHHLLSIGQCLKLLYTMEMGKVA